MRDGYDQVEHDYAEYQDSDYGQIPQEEAWIYGTMSSFQQIIKSYGIKFVMNKLTSDTRKQIEEYFIESDPF